MSQKIGTKPRKLAFVAAVGIVSMGVPFALTPASADSNYSSSAAKSSSATSTPASQASVMLENMAFSPTTLTVAVGTKVTWMNMDNVAHTVTSGLRGKPDGLFDAKLDDGGSTFSFVFTKAGTFNYYCKPHANMNAKIIVTDAAPVNSAATTDAYASNAANSSASTAAFTSTPASKANTEHGPISAEDIAFIENVRRAGLWEAPAGQRALQVGSDSRVKDIGNHIMTEHQDLDVKVQALAKQLDIDLPNEPNSDQQAWLDELNQLSGKKFDDDFVFRLRAAHGKVFQQIAEVRANTTNDDVRNFATEANTIVMRHMTYLESTGLVDYAKTNSVFTTTGAAQNVALKNTAATKASSSDALAMFASVGFLLLMLMGFLYKGTHK